MLSTLVIIIERKLQCSDSLYCWRWTLFDIWPIMFPWYISCCFGLSVFLFFWKSLSSFFLFGKFPFRLMKWNFPWQENKEEMGVQQQEDIILNLLRKEGIYSVNIIVPLLFFSTKWTLFLEQLHVIFPEIREHIKLL